MGSAHVAGFRKETHLGSTDAHAEPSGSRANDVGVLHRHNLHRRRTSFTSGVRRLLVFSTFSGSTTWSITTSNSTPRGRPCGRGSSERCISALFSQIMVAFGLPTLGFNT